MIHSFFENIYAAVPGILWIVIMLWLMIVVMDLLKGGPGPRY